MLIPSDRHSPRDIQAWERLEYYDQALAQSRDLEALEERAMDIIRDFADAECYVSTSWGKDSTVLVDLVGRTGVDIPIVFLSIDGYEQAGTTEVRDRMLALHPHLRYDELTLPPQPNRWWDTQVVKRSKWDADIGWRLIERRYGPRRMTGIRAEESRMRSMVMGRFGDATENTARPIGRWDATHVFAYLHGRGLPVHPAYAMSHGGQLDRRWLRVHALGGVSGADRGRAEWEQHYFWDIIHESRLRDAIMGALPTQRRDAELVSTIASRADYPTHEVQAWLEAHEGPAIAHRMKYATRWYRETPWPPEPHWLRGPDEPSSLF